MRTFIAPFRTAASVHPRTPFFSSLSLSPLPRISTLFLPVVPPPPALSGPSRRPSRPRGGPARVLIANLTSFADSMGFFRHRPMRTIIDDTVGSRPVSIFRRVSSPHRHLFPDGWFRLSSSNYACARHRAEKRRSSLYYYRCPFPRDLY